MTEEKDKGPSLKSPLEGENWLEFLRGSVYKYPVIAILPALIFLAVYYIDFCMSLFALPLSAVLLLWLFRVKNLWHQLAVGAIALFIAVLLIAVAEETSITEQIGGISSNDNILTNGKVTPFRGDTNTNYTFTLMVQENATSVNAYVILYGTPINKTMTLVSHTNGSTTWNFTTSFKVENSLSIFYFAAVIDGKWHETAASYGPVSSDAFAVYGYMVGALLLPVFANCFAPFIIMILFLRLSTKSREARDKVMKDYQMKKAQIMGGGPNANVPASGGATGAIPEDTFVCSECGSEVRATAKYCPNCGEPFDEDEEGKPAEPEKEK